MNENPLVSIAIPAYNKPEYTRKTIKSIIDQNYRPIEVVLSDDGSPKTLKHVFESFCQDQDNDFSIKFFRHKENLGPMTNVIFALDKIKGKYMILMPHDDWLIDPLFIQGAVEVMESNSDCNMCCANSIVENEDGAKINEKLPDHLDAEKTWKIVEGDRYINMLEKEINYQACSAIVCNWEVLKKMGGYHYPFNLTEKIVKPLGILADEGHSHHFLLSSVGSVAVTNKVVSVRGMPADSYSKTNSWISIQGQALFMLMYNIYKADLTGKYAKTVKKRAREFIFDWPAERINLKIIKHYKYNPEAIFLLIKSHIFHLQKKYKYLHYFIRTITIVKNRDYKDVLRLYKKLKAKIKDHGVLFVLKRIMNPFF